MKIPKQTEQLDPRFLQLALERNEALPWWPFYVDDFAKGTRDFTVDEKGAYVALLNLQWEMGFLPANISRIATLLGVHLGKAKRLWTCLASKFPPLDDHPEKLVNRRMWRERAITIQRIEKAKRKAESRWSVDGALVGEDVDHAAASAGADATADARHRFGQGKTDAAPMLQHHTDHIVTSSYVENARTRAMGGDVAGIDALWMNVLGKTPGDSGLWAEVSKRIRAAAELLDPPKPPAVYGRELVQVMPAFIAWARTQPWRSKPELTVRAFMAHFERLERWVREGGAPKDDPAKSGERSEPPPRPQPQPVAAVLNRPKPEEIS